MSSKTAGLAAFSLLVAVAADGALAQQSPTSLLPPALGQQQPAPQQPNRFEPQSQSPQLQPTPQPNAFESQVPAPRPQPQWAPQPQPQFAPEVQSAEEKELAPGPQVLGTIPAGSLGVIPQGALGPVTGNAFGETLQSIGGPMPAAPLQRAAREILIDRAFAETSDPIARARALYSLGFAEDAAGAVVDARPESVADRAITARALLAVGHTEQACLRSDVASLPEDAEPEPTFELLEVLAFCKVEQGSRDAASQIADLLREQGGSDELFFAGFAMAGGGGGGLPDAGQVERVRPIHLALMRRAGIAIPADYVMRADTALLGTISRSDSIDQAARIAATERAVEAGLAPVNSLISLYETTSLDERLLMQATTGVVPAGPLARAHLFALIAEGVSPAERIGFISALYTQGRQAGVGGAVAEAIGEDAAGVAPDPSLGRAAPLMIEILTRADRARAALGWIDAGEFPGPDGRPALDRFAAHRNRAMVAVLAPDLGPGVAAGALGADAGGAALSEAEREFVATEVAVMTALGDFVSPVLTSFGGQPTPTMPAQSPTQVLEALAPLAGADLTKVDRAALIGAVSALATYGLNAEARLLAVEILAARGAA